MRKLLSVIVIGAMVLTPITADAGKKKKKKKKPPVHQEQTGTIALPAPYPADTSCWTGLHRRINVYAQGQVNGVVGYHFDVDPATAGKTFKIEPSDPDADIDISFYSGMGDPADPAGAPANIGFETRQAGGESGEVPEGMPLVLVCVMAGENVEFTYEAGDKVKPLD